MALNHYELPHLNVKIEKIEKIKKNKNLHLEKKQSFRGGNWQKRTYNFRD
jgi:hypothetical protein